MVRVKVNILHGNTNTVQNDWGWTQRIMGDWTTQGVDRCPMFELLPVCKPFMYQLACPCGRARKGEGEGDREKEEGLQEQTGEIKARTLSLLLWPAGSGSWQLKKQPLATSPSQHTSTSTPRRPHMIYSSHLPSWKMTLQHWINPAYSRVQGMGAHFIPLSISSHFHL